MSLNGIVAILLVIGGLNWGLDAMGYNIVDMIFGDFAMWIYYLVGLAAVYALFTMMPKMMK
ncbi:MAG: DUF378 domain-containing protein [Patescibacteria group bacterium]|nr:DUF378 domain-containing protein [Patescibacteria group bacterium]